MPAPLENGDSEARSQPEANQLDGASGAAKNVTSSLRRAATGQVTSENGDAEATSQPEATRLEGAASAVKTVTSFLRRAATGQLTSNEEKKPKLERAPSRLSSENSSGGNLNRMTSNDAASSDKSGDLNLMEEEVSSQRSNPQEPHSGALASEKIPKINKSSPFLVNRSSLRENSSQLDSLLKNQFGTASSNTQSSGGYQSEASDTDDDTRSHDVGNILFGRSNIFADSTIKAYITDLVNNKFFIGFYTALTIYALFAPDLDGVFGNKQSKIQLSYTTTVVFFLFALEVLLQSIGKIRYFCASYFWLDIVALVSLLPDTWLVQFLFNTNAFVAGRTSRLTKIIRVVARSSKVTRLNRLTRMVRVAALIPRVAAMFRSKVSEKEAQLLLDQKLRRVFHALDDDMNGYISYKALNVVLELLAKQRPLAGTRRLSPQTLKLTTSMSTSSAQQVSKTRSVESDCTHSPPRSESAVSAVSIQNLREDVIVHVSESNISLGASYIGDEQHDSAIVSCISEFSPRLPVVLQSEFSPLVPCSKKTRLKGLPMNGLSSSGAQPSHHATTRISHCKAGKFELDSEAETDKDTPQRHRSASDANKTSQSNNGLSDVESDVESDKDTRQRDSAGSDASFESGDNQHSGPDSRASDVAPTSSSKKNEVRFAGSTKGLRGTVVSGDEDGLVRRRSSGASKATTMTKMSGWTVTENDAEPDLDFADFKEALLDDEFIKNWLLGACREEVVRTENMQNIGYKHMEDVGVKVALGILLMLFVLSLLNGATSDESDILALQQLDAQVRMYPDWLNSTTIPIIIQEQIVQWEAGLSRSNQRGYLLYLDIGKMVVCNLLSNPDRSCLPSVDQRRSWEVRSTLENIDVQTSVSNIRKEDLSVLRVPEPDNSDISLAELNSQVTSVALFNVRKMSEAEAISSLETTLLVITIILLGIFTLTRDLNSLSRSLLKPLRTLGNDMNNIAALQLAGLSSDENQDSFFKGGAAEVQLIHKMFEKTKKGIRSWGKYVPWPVVQLLLSAGVDATQGVKEMEVTMFFSDIASFTTIVEKLPPERSLLLLSRYFNDMSQVIDDHGGIVIEFIGDAIMSVFGAPIAHNHHPEACVRATMKMLRALDKINDWSSKRDLPNVSIRCGIHTGKVLVGNMGFHSRMKYGVVGENSNIPSKLEELNKSYGTTMLMSQDTYDRLPANIFVIRSIDYIYLRSGGKKAELVYQVLAKMNTSGKTHKLEKPAAYYDAALTAYKNRDFLKAGKLFRRARNGMKVSSSIDDDPPSKILEQRCRFYLQNPPANDWDGVWDQPSEP